MRATIITTYWEAHSLSIYKSAAAAADKLAVNFPKSPNIRLFFGERIDRRQIPTFDGFRIRLFPPRHRNSTEMFHFSPFRGSHFAKCVSCLRLLLLLLLRLLLIQSSLVNPSSAV